LEEAFRQAGFRDRAARSLGYLPLRYEWHAVASAPGTALPPQDIAALKTNLLKVIEDVFWIAGCLIYSTLGALIV